MSLFNELKRRNVFRVAAAYLVISWLLVQVLGLAASSFEAPTWVMKMIITLLAIGFIPTILFSWAYELTPEGLKKDSEVDPNKSNTSHTGKKLNTITLIAVIAAGGMFAYQQMNPTPINQNPSNNSVTTEKMQEINNTNQVSDDSIAVLPFVDLSPDKDQSHFSDGIAEEILNVLVRIEDLTVASRTSAFGFKGQEALGIPLIAERLKVKHILEGSVRKSGDTVRITAQLIDAQTDAHLWSNTFDRQLTTENIFAVQDEIAGAIVKQLGLMIGDKSMVQPHVKVTTENVDAYELYLKAKALYHARSRDNLPETVELYEHAVAIDPNFAEAWAGLSATYLVMPGWNLGTDEEYYPKARKAADRATELDNNLALPYTVRGAIISEQGDMITAMEQMNIAFKLEPKNIQTIYFRATQLLDMGYLDQAFEGLNHCLTLDPNYEICRRFLSFVLLYQGDVEKANELFEVGLIKGQYSYLYVFLNYYAAVGDNRAVALLISSMFNNDIGWRELVYKLNTDTSFSLDDFNKGMRTLLLNDQIKDASIEDYYSIDAVANRFLADFLWSPYIIFLRRPDLTEEYLQARKKNIQKFRFDDYWRQHGFPPQCRAIGDDDFECDVLKGVQ